MSSTSLPRSALAVAMRVLRSCTRHLGVRGFSFALLASATPAFANGRFPNAEQLREISPGSLVVSGTYGLLVSGNSQDFQFVCESALFGKTLMGSWVDPLLEVLPNGTILSGSVNGLRVSRDFGCSFRSDWSLPHDPSFIPPDPQATGAPGTIVDLCPAYDTARGAVALATLTQADGSTLEHRLYHTADAAETWTQLGVAIPTAMAHVVLTVDVAPSDSNRIYVSGSLLGKSVLVVSQDDGATWTPHPLTIPDSAGVGGLYIAAVSPTDPERVYLRVNRQSQADDGSTTWDDSLLVSDDGGVSTREILRQPAALLGFALSPDGGTVLAGYGDPVVAPIVASDAAVGLYSASAADLNFSHKIAGFYPSCLRWALDGLYACAKESDPLGATPMLTDFHVGVFKGDGVPSALSDFTPLLKLKDLRGPMRLASGQPSSCEAEWATGDPNSPGQASVCMTLNACSGDAGAVPLSSGAIVCGLSPDAGADAGLGSAVSGGGASGAGPTNPSGSAGRAASSGGAGRAMSAPMKVGSRNGCGCSVPRSPVGSVPPWPAPALAVLACWRALRRRSRYGSAG